MSHVNERRKRQVIPRWKLSKTASSQRETESHLQRKPREDDLEQERYLEERLRDWRVNSSLGFAADLLSTAVVLHRPELAREAAEYITENADLTTRDAARLASKVLNKFTPDELPPDPTHHDLLVLEETRLRNQVRSLRRQLILFPHNPVSWADLSRAFLSLGQQEKAERALKAALTLAPDHRYPLRSAARLYTHLGDPERAIHLLRKSPAVPHDPWLVAAEISTSALAEVKPAYTKQARQLLEPGRIAPLHTSEMAAAIATLELAHGSDNRSRKLMRRALEDPTENTVAQAQWASREISLFSALEPHLKQRDSHEARAWNFYFSGQLQQALAEVYLWLQDEPFSVHPVMLGASLNHLSGGDYALSIKLTQHGLRASPHGKNAQLLNNMAYYLALSDNAEEASRYLGRIRPEQLDEQSAIYLPATYGLVLFRTGKPEEGRRLYLEAIERSRKTKEKTYWEALALINLAREELLLDAQAGASALAQAEAAVKRAVEYGPGLRLLLQGIKTQNGAGPSQRKLFLM